MEMITQILFAVAIFLVYFFSVISGGAGLIVRSFLIFMGLPPQVAIGTARLSHLGTKFISLTQFHKYKKIDWKLALILFVPSAIGGILGAQFVASVSEDLLKNLIGIVVIVLGFVLFYNKNVGVLQKEHIQTKFKIFLGFFSVIGTNIVGSVTGGSGILFSYVLIFLYGKTYITASATRKVAGYGGSISSSVFFLYYGFVNWQFVLITLIAGGLGSYFGVHYGIKRGEEWVRKLTLFVIFFIGFKILFL